jgi:hypothetical protein
MHVLSESELRKLKEDLEKSGKGPVGRPSPRLKEPGSPLKIRGPHPLDQFVKNLQDAV